MDPVIVGGKSVFLLETDNEDDKINWYSLLPMMTVTEVKIVAVNWFCYPAQDEAPTAAPLPANALKHSKG